MNKKDIESVLLDRGFCLGWYEEKKCYAVYDYEEYKYKNETLVNPVDPSKLTKNANIRIHDLGLSVLKRTPLSRMWTLKPERIEE